MPRPVARSRTLLRVLLIAVVGVALYVSSERVPVEGTVECACEVARETDAWCEACGQGFLAGVAISSREVFEALDAHGHDFELGSIECASCRAAIASEGFCEVCGYGYWRDQAYLSRLSYDVVRAERPDELDCETCRALRGGEGWCADCGRGWIGTVASVDRGSYEAARAAYRVLLRALDEAERCELCAASMVIDGRCPRCAVTYRAGEPSGAGPAAQDEGGGE